MLRTPEVGIFHWPVGCPQPPAGEAPSQRYVEKWLREKNPSTLGRVSYGTYAGAAATVIGIASCVIGFFKENKVAKWIGGFLAGIGAFVTLVGNFCGIEWDSLGRLYNNLLISPNNKVEATPAKKGIKSEEVSIKTSRGELKGHFIPAPVPTKKTIMFLNGHGYNASLCFEEFNRLQNEVPVNVLMVDYCGVGSSTLNKGEKFTQEGLVLDAEAMYDYLVQKKNLTANDISIFGASLGGAVAIELANRKEVNTLLVQSSFTTVEDIVKDRSPALINNILGKLIGKLARSEFDSYEAIKTVKAKRVIVSHGKKDEDIPFSHGERLFSAVTVPEKIFLPLEGAGHADFTKFYDSTCFRTFRKYFGLLEPCEAGKQELQVA